MNRSGYSDDCEYLELYRANVERSIKSKRGQAFLKELADALDAMPVKELIEGDLVTDDGQCCAIGAVCLSRGLQVTSNDPTVVGELVGISRIMAAEIMFINDEEYYRRDVTPAERWKRVREWVTENLQTT